MPVTLYQPIVYGDVSGDLGDHAQAADQVLDFSNSDTNTRTVVGDARNLLAHAAGGDDVITNFAFGAATAIGDAVTISGYARGGDDVVRAGSRGGAAALGDAVSMWGHAHGGNDTVLAQSDFAATAYGDADTMSGHAVGGNDSLTGSNAHGSVTLIGDAETMADHVRGGGDTLAGRAGYPAEMFGDAKTLTGSARGGDDLLVGGANIPEGAPFSGPNYLYGDGLALLDHAHAGDDTLVSGQGADDIMWGDAAIIGPHAVRGQNLFVFGPQNGHDQIMDYRPGVDRIELVGFGFSSFQEVASYLQTTPDGVLLSFDAGDDILLRGVSMGQLTGRDFVLA